MTFVNTPVLENETMLLRPLHISDRQALYDVAKDSVLWEHHPIKDGHTPEGFLRFFDDALSIGSLLIVDKIEGKVIGCTRMYDYNARDNSLVIGHTFIRQACWGKGYNGSLKTLLLDYAFSFANRVLFYVVVTNIRSQKALEKMGAAVIANIIRHYNGQPFQCLVYQIER